MLLGSIFLFRPEWLLNEKTLHWAAEIASTQGIDVKWDKAEIRISSHSIFRKHFEFFFQEICFRGYKFDFSGCGQEISFEFTAHFGHWIPRVFELGPVHIRDFNWEIAQEDGDLVHGKINLVGKENTGKELQNLGRWIFEFSGSAHFSKSLQLQTEGWIQLTGDRLRDAQAKYSFDARFQKKAPEKAPLKIKRKVTPAYAFAHLEGVADLKHIQTEVTGTGTGWLEEIPKITLHQCNLEFVRGKFVKPHELTARCPLRVKIPVPPLDIAPGVHIPTELGAFLRADITSSTLIPGAETHIEGPAHLELDPILTPLLQGEGKVDAKVNGTIGDFPNKGTLEGQVGIRLKIPSFENLVSRLRKSEWAVPAPFHVFSGSGELQIQGESTLQEGKFPFTVQTQLISKAQKLDLDGKGQLEFEEGPQDKLLPQVQFDLLLSDVQLALPRLDWTVPPKIFPDSRIKKTLEIEPEDQGPPSLKYQINIRTAPGKPARILSNLTPAIIPVAVNLSISESSTLHGRVNILQFPVEAFRRKATLDHFDLLLKSPMGDSPIDGAIHLDYADYTVTVHLEGTSGKPVLHLTSEPPLPENQLFAVLLFGQPIEELDPEQADSVGGARAAVASGAMSLASLYILASTPIQSLDYNPETKTLSAKIRLGDGTSLNLGTAGDSASVGLRRRLGANWSIETELSNIMEQKGVASAYLQWSRRY
jgi:hypothetical protein